jgi:hypothetical protein
MRVSDIRVASVLNGLADSDTDSLDGRNWGFVSFMNLRKKADLAGDPASK